MRKFLHFNIPIAAGHKTSFRKKWQSRTVAADPLSIEEVQALTLMALGSKNQAVSQLTCRLNIGVTFVSLKDNYCKATGRNEAIAKMKEVDLIVKGATITETHIFVHLATFRGVALSLRANKASGYSTVVGVLEGE